MADYNRAIETIEKAPLTSAKRDQVATMVADVRFLAAGLMREARGNLRRAGAPRRGRPARLRR